MITIDIESEEIVPGAPQLPVPVGCAIRWEDATAKYYAWGHPEGNNCTKEEFREILLSIWDKPLLGHNSDGFDLQDLEHHFNLPPRDPSLNFDTLFAAYLYDPHAKSLRLKDLAEEWLGMPPDEQADLHDWIMENVPDCRSRKQCGAFIAKAPVRLVGPYAVGDVERTYRLWQFLEPNVPMEALHRERELAPILAKTNHRGVRVDMPALYEAHRKAVRAKARITRLIRERLEVGRECDVAKNADLGAALMKKGFSNFLLTPKAKQPSMSRESLQHALQDDPELCAMLDCRSRYEKLLNTFIIPWIKFGRVHGGRLHARYNQVRTPEDEDGNSYGTRTGRLSCIDPNLQQASKDKKGEKGLDYFGDPYPSMRSFLLPEEGHVWLCADLKNQEPRLAAHFENGELMRAFQKNPQLDPYMWIVEICRLKGATARDVAKVIFLGLLYAMGKAKLAEKLGISEKEAGDLRWTIKQYLADLVDLDNECKSLAKAGASVRTIGGRTYFCEVSPDGRDLSYKTLNKLIQGSAADQTKEIIIQADKNAPYALLLIQVHDEVNYSVPVEMVEELKQVLHAGANHIPVDVLMLLDVGIGKNWAEAKP